MAFDTHLYLVALLTIAYPLVLVGVVLFVRYMGRKAAAEGGERRRRPLLRRVLNLLAAVPIIFIVGYVALQFKIELESRGTPLSVQFYFISALAAIYPVLLAFLILRLRQEVQTKGRRAGTEERRSRFGLRRLVNMMIVAPIVLIAFAALMFLVPRL